MNELFPFNQIPALTTGGYQDRAQRWLSKACWHLTPETHRNERRSGGRGLVSRAYMSNRERTTAVLSSQVRTAISALGLSPDPFGGITVEDLCLIKEENKPLVVIHTQKQGWYCSDRSQFHVSVKRDYWN